LPLNAPLSFTGGEVHNYKISLIQILAVALYFPIYSVNVIAAFLYAFIFVVGGLLALKRTFESHNKDSSLKPLAITLATDLFAIIIFFANAYEIFGTVKNGNEAIVGLWQHSYFSVVTFTTLGYGDYLPVNNAQIIAVIEALFGFGYFALTVGIFGSILYQRISKT
jgi:hypothetical protein